MASTSNNPRGEEGRALSKPLIGFAINGEDHLRDCENFNSCNPNSMTMEGLNGEGDEGSGEEAIEWNDEGEEEEEARMELGLVGKLWTKRSIKVNAFMTTMKNIWQPTHSLDISSMGDNTFVFQFHHWRDKRRVVEGQPWHFDKHASFSETSKVLSNPHICCCMNYLCG